MNTREIAAEYRLGHWAQIMQERATSGTNIRAYCKQAGYTEHVYYYWQRRLREAACRELMPRREGSCEGARNAAGWALCTSKEPESEAKGLTIEIGGCKVQVRGEVEPEQLKQVCRVLLGLC